MEPPRRTFDRQYWQIAAGGTVAALTVIAPLTMVVAIAAARFAGGPNAFTIALVTTILTGLLGGGLAAPTLRRVVDRRAGLARTKAAHGGRRH